MRIAFVTFYDGAGSGVRVLGSLAQSKGHDVRLFILHHFRIVENSSPMQCPNAMQSICNGTFRVKKSDLHPITEHEIQLCISALLEGQYDLIALSSRSTDMPEALHLIKQLRQALPHTHLIAGGHGPTYDPEAYLKSGVSWLVRGEGEGAFLDILDALLEEKDIAAIENVAFLTSEGVQLNKLRPFIQNFDDLPLPLVSNDHVVYIEDDIASYKDPQAGLRRYGTALGRGCIGKCTYCGSESWNRLVSATFGSGALYRHKSFEKFFDELECAKEKGARYIVFNDEYLVLPPADTLKLFTEYKKRINLPFSVNLHPRQLLGNEEIFEAVLEAGLDAFTIGFQSGSEEFSRNIFHRTLRFDQLLTLAHRLYDRDIAIASHFISGATFNTDEEWHSKLSLVSQLPFDPMNSRHSLIMDFQYMPTPGSRLCEISERRISAQEWSKRALCAQLRHISTDAEFEETVQSLDDSSAQQLAQRYATIKQRRADEYRQNVIAVCATAESVIVYDDTASLDKRLHLINLLPKAQLLHVQRLSASSLPAGTETICLGRNTLALDKTVKKFSSRRTFAWATD